MSASSPPVANMSSASSDGPKDPAKLELENQSLKRRLVQYAATLEKLTGHARREIDASVRARDDALAAAADAAVLREGIAEAERKKEEAIQKVKELEQTLKDREVKVTELEQKAVSMETASQERDKDALELAELRSEVGAAKREAELAREERKEERERAERLHEEVAELGRQLADTKQVEMKVRDLEVEKLEAEKAKEKAEAELTEIRAKEEGIRSERDLFQKRHQDGDAEVVKLRQELDAKSTRVDELEQAVKSVEGLGVEKIGAAEGRAKQAEDSVTALRKELDQVHGQLSDTKSALEEARVASIAQEVQKEAVEEREALKANLSTIQDELEQSNELLTRAAIDALADKQRIRKLEDSLYKMRTSLNTEREERRQKEQKIAQLSTSVQNAEHELDDLRTTKRTLSDECHKLQLEIHEQSNTVATKSRELEQLGVVRADRETTVQKLQLELSNSKNSLAKKESEFVNMAAEYQEVCNQLNTSSKDLETRHVEIATMRRDLSSYKDRVVDLETEAERNKLTFSELQAARRQLQELTEKFAEKESSIAEISGALTAAKNESAGALREKKRLSDMLADVSGDLKRANQELDILRGLRKDQEVLAARIADIGATSSRELDVMKKTQTEQAQVLAKNTVEEYQRKLQEVQSTAHRDIAETVTNQLRNDLMPHLLGLVDQKAKTIVRNLAKHVESFAIDVTTDSDLSSTKQAGTGAATDATSRSPSQYVENVDSILPQTTARATGSESVSAPHSFPDSSLQGGASEFTDTPFAVREVREEDMAPEPRPEDVELVGDGMSARRDDIVLGDEDDADETVDATGTDVDPGPRDVPDIIVMMAEEDDAEEVPEIIGTMYGVPAGHEDDDDDYDDDEYEPDEDAVAGEYQDEFDQYEEREIDITGLASSTRGGDALAPGSGNEPAEDEAAPVEGVASEAVEISEDREDVRMEEDLPKDEMSAFTSALKAAEELLASNDDHPNESESPAIQAASDVAKNREGGHDDLASVEEPVVSKDENVDQSRGASRPSDAGSHPKDTVDQDPDEETHEPEVQDLEEPVEVAKSALTAGEADGDGMEDETFDEEKREAVVEPTEEAPPLAAVEKREDTEDSNTARDLKAEQDRGLDIPVVSGAEDTEHGELSAAVGDVESKGVTLMTGIAAVVSSTAAVVASVTGAGSPSDEESAEPTEGAAVAVEAEEGVHDGVRSPEEEVAVPKLDQGEEATEIQVSDEKPTLPPPPTESEVTPSVDIITEPDEAEPVVEGESTGEAEGADQTPAEVDFEEGGSTTADTVAVLRDTEEQTEDQASYEPAVTGTPVEPSVLVANPDAEELEAETPKEGMPEEEEESGPVVVPGVSADEVAEPITAIQEPSPTTSAARDKSDFSKDGDTDSSAVEAEEGDKPQQAAGVLVEDSHEDRSDEPGDEGLDGKEPGPEVQDLEEPVEVAKSALTAGEADGDGMEDETFDEEKREAVVEPTEEAPPLAAVEKREDTEDSNTARDLKAEQDRGLDIPVVSGAEDTEHGELSAAVGDVESKGVTLMTGIAAVVSSTAAVVASVTGAGSPSDEESAEPTEGAAVAVEAEEGVHDGVRSPEEEVAVPKLDQGEEATEIQVSDEKPTLPPPPTESEVTPSVDIITEPDEAEPVVEGESTGEAEGADQTPAEVDFEEGGSTTADTVAVLRDTEEQTEDQASYEPAVTGTPVEPSVLVANPDAEELEAETPKEGMPEEEEESGPVVVPGVSADEVAEPITAIQEPSPTTSAARDKSDFSKDGDTDSSAVEAEEGDKPQQAAGVLVEDSHEDRSDEPGDEGLDGKEPGPEVQDLEEPVEVAKSALTAGEADGDGMEDETFDEEKREAVVEPTEEAPPLAAVEKREDTEDSNTARDLKAEQDRGLDIPVVSGAEDTEHGELSAAVGDVESKGVTLMTGIAAVVSSTAAVVASVTGAGSPSDEESAEPTEGAAVAVEAEEGVHDGVRSPEEEVAVPKLDQGEEATEIQVSDEKPTLPPPPTESEVTPSVDIITEPDEAEPVVEGESTGEAEGADQTPAEVDFEEGGSTTADTVAVLRDTEEQTEDQASYEPAVTGTPVEPSVLVANPDAEELEAETPKEGMPEEEEESGPVVVPGVSADEVAEPITAIQEPSPTTSAARDKSDFSKDGDTDSSAVEAEEGDKPQQAAGVLVEDSHEDRSDEPGDEGLDGKEPGPEVQDLEEPVEVAKSALTAGEADGDGMEDETFDEEKREAVVEPTEEAPPLAAVEKREDTEDSNTARDLKAEQDRGLDIPVVSGAEDTEHGELSAAVGDVESKGVTLMTGIAAVVSSTAAVVASVTGAGSPSDEESAEPTEGAAVAVEAEEGVHDGVRSPEEEVAVPKLDQGEEATEIQVSDEKPTLPPPPTESEVTPSVDIITEPDEAEPVVEGESTGEAEGADQTPAEVDFEEGGSTTADTVAVLRDTEEQTEDQASYEPAVTGTPVEPSVLVANPDAEELEAETPKEGMPEEGEESGPVVVPGVSADEVAEPITAIQEPSPTTSAARDKSDFSKDGVTEPPAAQLGGSGNPVKTEESPVENLGDIDHSFQHKGMEQDASPEKTEIPSLEGLGAPDKGEISGEGEEQVVPQEAASVIKETTEVEKQTESPATVEQDAGVSRGSEVGMTASDRESTLTPMSKGISPREDTSHISAKSQGSVLESQSQGDSSQTHTFEGTKEGDLTKVVSEGKMPETLESGTPAEATPESLSSPVVSEVRAASEEVLHPIDSKASALEERTVTTQTTAPTQERVDQPIEQVALLTPETSGALPLAEGIQESAAIQTDSIGTRGEQEVEALPAKAEDLVISREKSASMSVDKMQEPTALVEGITSELTEETETENKGLLLVVQDGPLPLVKEVEAPVLSVGTLPATEETRRVMEEESDTLETIKQGSPGKVSELTTLAETETGVVTAALPKPLVSTELTAAPFTVETTVEVPRDEVEIAAGNGKVPAEAPLSEQIVVSRGEDLEVVAPSEQRVAAPAEEALQTNATEARDVAKPTLESTPTTDADVTPERDVGEPLIAEGVRMPTAIVETEVMSEMATAEEMTSPGGPTAVEACTEEAEKSAKGNLKVAVAAESAKEMTAQKERSSPVAEVLEPSVQEESEVRAAEESVTAITKEPGAAQADEKDLKPAVLEEQDVKFTPEETQQQVSVGQQAAVTEPAPRKRDLEGTSQGELNIAEGSKGIEAVEPAPDMTINARSATVAEGAPMPPVQELEAVVGEPSLTNAGELQLNAAAEEGAVINLSTIEEEAEAPVPEEPELAALAAPVEVAPAIKERRGLPKATASEEEVTMEVAEAVVTETPDVSPSQEVLDVVHEAGSEKVVTSEEPVEVVEGATEGAAKEANVEAETEANVEAPVTTEKEVEETEARDVGVTTAAGEITQDEEEEEVVGTEGTVEVAEPAGPSINDESDVAVPPSQEVVDVVHEAESEKVVTSEEPVEVVEGATEGAATEANVEAETEANVEAPVTTEKEVEETEARDVGVTTAAGEITQDEEEEEVVGTEGTVEVAEPAGPSTNDESDVTVPPSQEVVDVVHEAESEKMVTSEEPVEAVEGATEGAATEANVEAETEANVEAPVTTEKEVEETGARDVGVTTAAGEITQDEEEEEVVGTEGTVEVAEPAGPSINDESDVTVPPSQEVVDVVHEAESEKVVTSEEPVEVVEGATEGAAKEANVEAETEANVEAPVTTEKEVEETEARDVGVTTAAGEITQDEEEEEVVGTEGTVEVAESAGPSINDESDVAVPPSQEAVDVVHEAESEKMVTSEEPVEAVEGATEGAATEANVEAETEANVEAPVTTEKEVEETGARDVGVTTAAGEITQDEEEEEAVGTEGTVEVAEPAGPSTNDESDVTVPPSQEVVDVVHEAESEKVVTSEEPVEAVEGATEGAATEANVEAPVTTEKEVEETEARDVGVTTAAGEITQDEEEEEVVGTEGTVEVAEPAGPSINDESDVTVPPSQEVVDVVHEAESEKVVTSEEPVEAVEGATEGAAKEANVEAETEANVEAPVTTEKEVEETGARDVGVTTAAGEITQDEEEEEAVGTEGTVEVAESAGPSTNDESDVTVPPSQEVVDVVHEAESEKVVTSEEPVEAVEGATEGAATEANVEAETEANVEAPVTTEKEVEETGARDVGVTTAAGEITQDEEEEEVVGTEGTVEVAESAGPSTNDESDVTVPPSQEVVDVVHEAEPELLTSEEPVEMVEGATEGAATEANVGTLVAKEAGVVGTAEKAPVGSDVKVPPSHEVVFLGHEAEPERLAASEDPEELKTGGFATGGEIMEAVGTVSGAAMAEEAEVVGTPAEAPENAGEAAETSVAEASEVVGAPIVEGTAEKTPDRIEVKELGVATVAEGTVPMDDEAMGTAADVTGAEEIATRMEAKVTDTEEVAVLVAPSEPAAHSVPDVAVASAEMTTAEPDVTEVAEKLEKLPAPDALEVSAKFAVEPAAAEREEADDVGSSEVHSATAGTQEAVIVEDSSAVDDAETEEPELSALITVALKVTESTTEEMIVATRTAGENVAEVSATTEQEST